jgi:NADH-quinone oxidoreductase E subunit
MGNVNITIDGIAVEGQEGMTILRAAKLLGIEIPTLCHHEELKPSGNCRVCVVEVEGSRTLVGSCHTPIQEGMVIYTQSAKVLSARRAAIELLLSGHTGPCVTDHAAKDCLLHELASTLEIGPPRFTIKRPRFYSVENVSLYVQRDLSKCILCRRCIRACREVAGRDVFAMAYRGFGSKIVVDCDVILDKDVCKDCGVCIDYCPTSALMLPEGVERREGISPSGTQQRSGQGNGKREELLGMLEKRQKESGFISEQNIEEIAEILGLSIGEVYGVATFYAFLSVKPRGRHIIRLCKSVPCYIKDSAIILESMEKIIGIGPGEITSDGRFTIEMTNCIGACDQAPAMMINDEIYGNLTPEKISEILESYK